MEEKHPYVREKLSTDFLGSPNSMDFAVSLMLWESDGETMYFTYYKVYHRMWM